MICHHSYFPCTGVFWSCAGAVPQFFSQNNITAAQLTVIAGTSPKACPKRSPSQPSPRSGSQDELVKTLIGWFLALLNVIHVRAFSRRKSKSCSAYKLGRRAHWKTSLSYFTCKSSVVICSRTKDSTIKHAAYWDTAIHSAATSTFIPIHNLLGMLHHQTELEVCAARTHVTTPNTRRAPSGGGARVSAGAIVSGSPLMTHMSSQLMLNSMNYSSWFLCERSSGDLFGIPESVKMCQDPSSLIHLIQWSNFMEFSNAPYRLKGGPKMQVARAIRPDGRESEPYWARAFAVELKTWRMAPLSWGNGNE